ncbi:DUF3772 domain-containing protein [Bordetella sp. 2513F-2]
MTCPISSPRNAWLWKWLLGCTLVLLSVLLGGPAAWAQPESVADADTQLTQARQRIETIRKQLDAEPEDAQLVEWRTTALDIQAQADGLAEALEPQLADVTARLQQLGPLAEGQKEAPDIAEQRAELEKANRNLDAQVKLARLLSVEAVQTAEQISGLRRNQFQASLGERRGTLLSPAFWAEWRRELPRDLERLQRLLGQLRTAAAATPLPVWLLLFAGIAVVLGLRIGIGKVLLRITATRVPPGRLRRSFLAVALLALSAAAPWISGLLLEEGLTRGGGLDSTTIGLLDEWVGILFLAGYVAGLGNALLSPHRPTWRLPSMPDAVAAGLRWLPTTLGILVPIMWLASRLPSQLNASLTTTIALNSLAAAALGAAAMGALVHGERLRRQAARDAGEERAPARPFWVSTLITLTWATLIAGLLGLLVGYAAFGTFLVTQVIWALVVLSSAYLASVLVEDGFSTLLAGRHRNDAAAQPRLRVQAAVLLSALARVLLLLIAAVMLISPFGEGPAELARRLEQLHRGLQIGEVQLRPGMLLQAALVLVLSLVIVRLLKRWLSKRYLPTTELDPGMQISAATLFGYAGVVVSVALGLSALGVSLERVAWIASALSVGIGFGLQAVVQNFVSGLILLAERPVKVGDWVSLGGIEGDIQRINVRATEIQMADRSTVIVPNSEFITKTVRNVTHANPLGRVQVRLPMPLGTDAARTRTLLLEAFAAQPEILESPEADVYLDGIEGQHLMFNAVGYVGSPRAAYGVRSRLLFDILQRLREAGLDIAPPATMVLREEQKTPQEPAPPAGASAAPPQA